MQEDFYSTFYKLHTLYISLNTNATSGFMNFHLNVELRMDILKSSFGIPFHDEKIAHSVS